MLAIQQFVLLPNALFKSALCIFDCCTIILQLLGKRATVHNYFMATRGTVKLSRGSGEELGNCCQWPRATVFQIFSITEGQWFDCSQSSLEITVLLPNCFKSPKHCQQYADTRRWRREIWCYVRSFVNSFNCSPLTRSPKLSCNSKKCVILISVEHWLWNKLLAGQQSTVDWFRDKLRHETSNAIT